MTSALDAIAAEVGDIDQFVSASASKDEAGAVGILNHELVHVLRNPSLWRSDFGLFERGEWGRLVRKAESDAGIVASVNKRYDDKGLTREQLQEEYVAEMYRLWKNAVDGYGAVERILLKIEDFVRALASAFRGEGFDSAGRIMQRIADGRVGARDPLRSERGAQSSVSTFVTSEMRQGMRDQIEAAWNGAAPSAPIVLGRFPAVMRALTGKDHPFVVSSAVVRKAGSHGLTLKDVLAAIDGLDDPVMAFDSTNESGNLTVLVDTRAEDGRSMVVGVDAAFKSGRVEISRIATIHGKNNDGAIIGWMRDGYLRYINKTKAGAWSRSIGRQLPKDGTTKHRQGKPILQYRDVFKDGMEMRGFFDAIKPKRIAQTFREAREAVKSFQGKDLVNGQTGLVARVSRTTLDKMLSGSAVSKSTSAELHSLAVANIDDLFARAVKGWDKKDARDEPSIIAIHRFFAEIQRPDGQMAMVKLTVKETAREGQPNPVYTIDAIDGMDASSATKWLMSAFQSETGPKISRPAEDVVTMAERVDAVNNRADGGMEMRADNNPDPAANPSVMASVSKMWGNKPATTDAALDKMYWIKCKSN